LVPTRPALPVDVAAIVACRQLVRLIVEEAFLHAVLARAVLILKLTPQNAVNELLKFVELFLVRLTELLHCRSEPGAGAAFVAKAGDPDASILRDLLVEIVIIGNGRGGAMKRVVRIVEPLLRG